MLGFGYMQHGIYQIVALAEAGVTLVKFDEFQWTSSAEAFMNIGTLKDTEKIC